MKIEGLRAQVQQALAEDMGRGDVTAALIAESQLGRARIRTRQAMICCGQAWVEAVFAHLSDTIELTWHVAEGAAVQADTVLLSLSGPARALMTGERVALNFLQTLSATATITRRYVDAVKHTNVTILDTRKTLPGLRHAQKYAVRCGGAQNHRLGLYDAFLIKENHISLLGGVTEAIEQARHMRPDLLLEIEVETLAQLQAAIVAKADRVLLDNFSLTDLQQAVHLAQSQLQLEASGNITLETIAAVAETGVDFISLGALTKHIQAIDLSMRVEF